MNLHMSHSWGGGTEVWVEGFAAADDQSENLALLALGTEECYGLRLRLIHVASGAEIETWTLRDPITEVRSTHPEHIAILVQICRRFDISHIYVSSLVGHSFDVFRLGIPCTKIYHDYFPFCPAFFVTREALCTVCNKSDLLACGKTETSHRPKGSPGYYVALRDAFFEVTTGGGVQHVSPSLSVPHNLRVLDARWRNVDFAIIEHGTAQHKANLFGGAEDGRRLHVGFLGQLGWNKGRELLRSSFEKIRAIVDLHMIGAGEAGVEYEGRWGVDSVYDYHVNELSGIVEQQSLDLVIFLSQVPESYSLTLSETWCFGIPPAARSLGAHAERISEGTDGFLFGLEDDAVIEFLLWADREREELRRVAQHIRGREVRSAQDAVRDYYAMRADFSSEREERPRLTALPCRDSR